MIEPYNLRYYRLDTPGSRCLVFADISSERATLDGLMKSCLVYTPPKYMLGGDETYPVLYLQHGHGVGDGPGEKTAADGFPFQAAPVDEGSLAADESAHGRTGICDGGFR